MTKLQQGYFCTTPRLCAAQHSRGVVQNYPITNALAKGAGHANISTTRLYDRRQQSQKRAPNYEVSYGGVGVIQTNRLAREK